MKQLKLKLKQDDIIDALVVLMTVAMFEVGRLCADSYEGTAENFVLKDWWHMGMYGNLKYILYDIVFIVLLWRHRPWLLLPYAFYTIFSVKDFIQFFINGNVSGLPDDYVIYLIGLVFFFIFQINKRKIMTHRKILKDGGTQNPHPPPEPPGEIK